MRNLDKIIVFQVPSNFVSIVGVKICHKLRETENKLLSKEMLVGLEPSYVQGPNTNPINCIFVFRKRVPRCTQACAYTHLTSGVRTRPGKGKRPGVPLVDPLG